MARLGPSRALTVIGWLFVVGGASAVLNGLAGPGPSYRIDFNVISLFLGIGLLRRRAWALRWSELWAVLSVFFAAPIAIALVLNLKPSSPATAAILGRSLGEMSRTLFLVGVLTTIALSVWEYRTLVREDVRALAKTT